MVSQSALTFRCAQVLCFAGCSSKYQNAYTRHTYGMEYMCAKYAKAMCVACCTCMHAQASARGCTHARVLRVCTTGMPRVRACATCVGARAVCMGACVYITHVNFILNNTHYPRRDRRRLPAALFRQLVCGSARFTFHILKYQIFMNR